MPKDLSDINLHRLIDYLYQTLQDFSIWPKVLDEISKAINCKYIHAFTVDKKSKTIQFSKHNTGLHPFAEMDFINHYKFVSSLIELSNKPIFDWWHEHENLIANSTNENIDYHEFFKPYDLKFFSACKLIDDEKIMVIFSVLSTPHQGSIQQKNTNFLNKILLHLARVIQLNYQTYVCNTQIYIGHSLVNKIRHPVIMSTTKGEILHVNDSGHKFLNETELIFAKDGYLKLCKQYNQKFYDEIDDQEKMITANKESSKSSFKVFHIQHPNKIESLFLFYSILQPEQMLHANGSSSILVTYFYQPDKPALIDQFVLSLAFKLTPAECRITNLLIQGFSQRDIATELNIKPDTVRKQLQVIYQKTDTRQQTDLVRLMLNIPTNL